MAIIYETSNLKLTPKGNDEDVLDLCIRAKIPIPHACEGMASCGTCRIIATDGLNTLSERNSVEQEMADDRGFAPEERLACQTGIEESFSFRLPED